MKLYEPTIKYFRLGMLYAHCLRKSENIYVHVFLSVYRILCLWFGDRAKHIILPVVDHTEPVMHLPGPRLVVSRISPSVTHMLSLLLLSSSLLQKKMFS